MTDTLPDRLSTAPDSPVYAEDLLAAGAGERLAAGRPKAFHVLAGQTLLERAYTAFAGHPGVDGIVVTAPADLATEVTHALSGRAVVVAGGRTRRRAAIDALAPR